MTAGHACGFPQNQQGVFSDVQASNPGNLRVQIEGNRIDGAHDPIELEDSQEVEVLGNWIRGTGSHVGISSYRAEKSLLSDNEIAWVEDGMVFYDGWRNRIVNNSVDSFDNGILLLGAAEELWLERNTVAAGGDSIRCEETAGSVFVIANDVAEDVDCDVAEVF